MTRSNCAYGNGCWRSKAGLKSDINVTPLVDVMLVLLIIMMLVAPMLQKGVDVKLPSAGNTSDKPDNQEQTVVAVDARNDKFYVNGIEVPAAETWPTASSRSSRTRPSASS